MIKQTTEVKSELFPGPKGRFLRPEGTSKDKIIFCMSSGSNLDSNTCWECRMIILHPQRLVSKHLLDSSFNLVDLNYFKNDFYH